MSLSKCRMIGFALLSFSFFISSQTALAVTFQVTVADCGAPTGLFAAILQANANPGPDIIEVTPGLVINVDSCPSPALGDDSTLQITDSLTIQGNSSAIHGANLWVSGSVTNRFDTVGECPRRPAYLIVGQSPSLFMIGERNVDNSGIEVTIENLGVENVSQLASIRDGAKLTMRQVSAYNIMDLKDCHNAAIEAFGDSDLILENVTMRRTSAFKYVTGSAMIFGDTGKLEIYDSEFVLNAGRYAVSWKGNADIVSSFFQMAGGVYARGPGIIRVINSLFLPAENDHRLRAWDGFLVLAGGIALEASTVVYPVTECTPGDGCASEAHPRTSTFQAIGGGGFIDFDESVLHVQALNPIYTPTGSLLLETASTGFFSATTEAFIQPLPWQDATALQSITGQPGLLTGSDALPVEALGPGFVDFHYPESVTPIITGGAILVDKILDAGPLGANELKDPRGSTIILDILGNPRVDSGRRSIGAVQNSVIPHLVANIGAQDPHSALLSWTQPTSAGITGYDVCHGADTPPDPVAIGTGCPGTLLEGFSTSASGTTGTVSGLPLAISHWFLVRAYAGATKEGWSNIASVSTPVTVTYPPAVVGMGTPIAPVVSGPLVDPVYRILTGMLPPGLTLNPSTGEITGSSSSGCGTSVGILVVNASGALVTTAITFSCEPALVPSLTGWSLIVLMMLLAGLGFLSLRRRSEF